MGTAFGLGKIKQISITVKDVARASDFYRNKLGMTHLFSTPNMAFFDSGGIRLMLSIAEKPEFDHPSSILYFEVEDIQGAFAVLKERDVVFEGDPHLVAKMEDHDLWLAFFRDSEHNLLALASEVREPK